MVSGADGCPFAIARTPFTHLKFRKWFYLWPFFALPVYSRKKIIMQRKKVECILLYIWLIGDYFLLAHCF